MDIKGRIRLVANALRGTQSLPPVPLVGVSDARWSVISSALDMPGQPTSALVELALAAATHALGFTFDDLAERSDPDFARWVNIWPGEHYRFLAGIASVLRPSTIVEVGTFKGHGAVALRSSAPDARVITYDIEPWQKIPGAILKHSDDVEQRIGDLADPDYLATQLDDLRSADLLFVDGPKDGQWEKRFCTLVLPELADRQRLMVFDDIRLLEMVQLWRDLPGPRLDATSLGHWSGTGLLHTA